MAIATIHREDVRLETLFTWCDEHRLRDCPHHDGEAAEDPDGLSLDALQERIDELDGVAKRRGREAVLAKVQIGRCLAAAKAQRPKGFVSWAKERWGYSQQYGTVLMRLAENHARVRALLDADPNLPLRKLAAAIRDALKDDEEAEPRAPHVFPVATPREVVLRVLDAGALPQDLPGYGDVNLVTTSWPYVIGQEERGYVDFTDCAAYLDAAAGWLRELVTVGAMNARYCLNLPIDTRKAGRPEPIAADVLHLARAAGLVYETTIVWRKAPNGQNSRTNAYGSVDSPNAPCVTTGDELIQVLHKGEWNLGRPSEPSDSTRAETREWRNAEWTITGASDPEYPHVWPKDLVIRLVKLFSFPGDLVADFHCGSGVSAVVAMQLGRRFVGGDINPHAVALASQRVAEAHAEATR